MLLSGYPNPDEILNGEVHSYLTSHPTGLSLCDYTHKEAVEILHDDSYFRFVILRDPLTRITSAYLEKFVVNPLPVGKNGEAPGTIGSAIDWVYRNRDEQTDYERSITFEEFINYVVNNNDLQLDVHFKSQDAYLKQQSFDFLGALEKPDKIIELLEPRFNQKISLEDTNSLDRRKPFWRRRGQGRLLPAQLRAQRKLPHDGELLSKTIVMQLKERYLKDFELWQKAME